MAYTIVDGKKQPVVLGGGGSTLQLKEPYVPAQNTDMIYIGIFIAVLALLILIYILYKKLKEESKNRV